VGYLASCRVAGVKPSFVVLPFANHVQITIGFPLRVPSFEIAIIGPPDINCTESPTFSSDIFISPMKEVTHESDKNPRW
jgi:hypothetical protein